MTTTPPTSSQGVVDRHAPVLQLEAHVQHKDVALWEERDDFLHGLEWWRRKELAQLHQEVQTLHQRVGYIEGGGQKTPEAG